MAQTVQAHQTDSAVGATGSQSPSLWLSGRERRALAWIKLWARQQLTQAKRARKYRAHEQVMDPNEVELLQALVALEQATGQLLQDQS